MADFADKTDFQSKVQSLMDDVYNEWHKDENKGKSKWDVLDNFSEAHQAAVVFGNFNYQVENGGLHQWIYNGYFDDDSEKLTEYLENGVGLDERCQKILDIIYKLDQNARDTDCDRDGYYVDPDDEDSESHFIGDMIDCDAFDSWYYEHCGGDDWWKTVGDVIEKVTGHDLENDFVPVSQDDSPTHIHQTDEHGENVARPVPEDAPTNTPETPETPEIAESQEIITLREFLGKHRGASVDAMTQGGYLYLTGEQTQNFESLSVVKSHLGVSDSVYSRPLDDELLGGVVQVMNFSEEANEYAIIVDEIAGARIIAQERSEAELSGKTHITDEAQLGEDETQLGDDEIDASDTNTYVSALAHPFSVYVQNVHTDKYSDSAIPFPADPAELRSFLDGVGIVDWRDIKGIEVSANVDDPTKDESDIWRLTNKLNDMLYGSETSPHTLNELNHLAARIEGLAARGEDGGINILLANIETDKNSDTIADMINLTFDENINKFDCWPVYDAKSYGDLLVNHFRQDEHYEVYNHLAESSGPEGKAFAAHVEMLEKHTDYKAFGNAVAKEEGGVFTEQGYLVGGDEGLLEIYRSPEDIPQEHIIQHEYPDELRFLTKHIPHDADRAELEYLAAKIQGMDAEQMKVFGAVVEAGMYCGSVAEIINTTENLDCFNLRPISGEDEYGMRRVEQDADDGMKAFDRLSASDDPNDRALVKHIMILSRAVDDGMYGHHAAKEEGGIFTNQGLLTVEATPHIIYLGTQDLPAEYRSSQPIVDVPDERTIGRAATDKSSPDAKPSVLAQIAEHREAQRREPKESQSRDALIADRKKSDPEL